jgi:GTP cyclohydrolase I
MSEHREAGIPAEPRAGPERPGPQGRERNAMSEHREAGIPLSSERGPSDGLRAVPDVSMQRVDKPRIERAVREILEAIGEDPDRDGLVRTPTRIAEMYAEIFSGLHDDPSRHITVTFEADHDEMVMLRDIPIHSLCEHHLVPFAGRAHVAYIPGPDGRITGLSKLARLVDGYAHRPQVQERLTTQVADALVEVLKPDGVFVVIEAEHFCMSMRGVKKPGSLTVTSAVRGLFKSNPATRAEAMSLITHPGNRL